MNKDAIRKQICHIRKLLHDIECEMGKEEEGRLCSNCKDEDTSCGHDHETMEEVALCLENNIKEMSGISEDMLGPTKPGGNK